MKKINLTKGKTVKLRKKAISSGYSLFLEYANNYKQEKIYLRIHLSKGDTPLRRKNDTDTWNKAEEIRQAVEDYIIKNHAQTLEYAYKLYIDEVNRETTEEEKKNTTLIEWLNKFREDKARTGQSKSLAVTITNLIKYVTDFTDGEKVLLTDVSKEWLEEFLMYLARQILLFVIDSQKVLTLNMWQPMRRRTRLLPSQPPNFIIIRLFAHYEQQRVTD